MVTSADVGEGKSITSVNFAVALAREIDHTVLLVDADMRKPSIHKYLGIKTDRGLSDYLSGQVELSDVLINTGLGRLVLLPAGNACSNPAELLSSNRMKELVKEMKHRYADRYIVIDTPPVLVSADAISMSNHVDGVIFVVQAAKTSEKTVKKAINLLKGAIMLGIVYNNVPDYLGKNLNPYYYHQYHRDDRTAAKTTK
jgi:exopolysaccharide/PEP-CTERM locus tyrosine autokinase